MGNITKVTQIKKLEHATQLIEKMAESTRQNLYIVASALGEVDRNKLYEEGEYKSTAEYGEAVFGYKRQTTSALVRVANRFLIGSESMLKVDGEKDYSVYQLMELLCMDDKDINESIKNGELSPYMTTKSIRELAKSFKPVLETKNEGEPEIKGCEKEECKNESHVEDSGDAIPERISYAATDISYYNKMKQDAIDAMTIVINYLEKMNNPSAQDAKDILAKGLEAVTNIVL